MFARRFARLNDVIQYFAVLYAFSQKMYVRQSETCTPKRRTEYESLQLN